jgi:small subunit ribosomal protein S6e
MVIKINISQEGKTYRLEAESNVLEGKSIGDKFNGKILKKELEDYEFEIRGGSDFAGFPMSKEIEGIGLKKVLLSKGWGMHSKPKGLKKKKPKLQKGLRLRKTVRGKTITEKTSQLNLNVIKKGSKPLAEIFPTENKAETQEQPTE